jgi:two-component system, OmpR family, phosphate regulon response regulator PhoB
MSGPANSAAVVSLQYANFADFVREAVRPNGAFEAQDPPPPFYRVALGLEPIQLGDVEFRILQFLASKPYRPFSRLKIAEAVTTQRLPVTEDTVDGHILSLRGQLGFFRDYVQTVPYLGYRFKA